MRALIDPVPSELVFLDLFRVSHFMPPPYKIQDLATPNNLFFFWGGGFVMNEARAALSGFDPATTKILEPFFIITGVWVEFWNACD